MTLNDAYKLVSTILNDNLTYNPRQGIIPQSVEKPKPAKPQNLQKQYQSKYKYQQAAIKRQETMQQPRVIKKNEDYKHTWGRPSDDH